MILRLKKEWRCEEDIRAIKTVWAKKTDSFTHSDMVKLSVQWLVYWFKSRKF